MKIDPPPWWFNAGVTFVLSLIVLTFTKLWDPVAAHKGYPFGVHHTLKQLGDKVKPLDAKIKEFVYHDPFPSSEVRKDWLERGKCVVATADEMKRSLEKKCLLNLRGRSKIGIEAQDEIKKAEALIVDYSNLPERGTSSTTKQGGASVHDDDRLLLVQYPGMESPYDKVVSFIKDNSRESVIMGIWGMVGVGKTTLMNLVYNSKTLCGEHFVEVVVVQPGKECNEVADLQKHIAGCMGLPQIANEISQACIIRNHLQDKNFLLLLDDLWKYFDLAAVGIPLLLHRGNAVQQHRCRKVVLTTRSMEVCSSMRCPVKYTIQMKCLNEKDSWTVFAQNVGNAICLDKKINGLAKEIVQECSGLPMALCTIGQSMSCKTDPPEWRTAIDQLKNSELHDDLFLPLQEIYAAITNEDMKKRLLLCSLWPENENISRKKLIRWWAGLRLLGRLAHNASDSGYTRVKDLLRASMLEKGETGLDSMEHSHVKMHSMIRKMAIGVVNNHGKEDNWLPNSLYRSTALPETLWYTVEKVWASQVDTSGWGEWSRKASFPQLKMLVAQHAFSIKLIRFFRKITFLDLQGVSVFCSGHFEPNSGREKSREEIERDDNNTWDIICNLIELQHLNLSSTSLGFLSSALQKLSKLTYLYIRHNMGLVSISENLILPKSLQGLDLFYTGLSYENQQKLVSSRRGLDMLGFTVMKLAEIKKLAVCTKALCLHQFQDENNLDIIDLKFLSELRELQELAIFKAVDSQKVLQAEGGPESSNNEELLPHLEIFDLNYLPGLEKVIWRNAGASIRVVTICNCDKLIDVTWVHHLEYLEELKISMCRAMERLIHVAMIGTETISFSRLQKLTLESLPELSMISEQACQFEELSSISVNLCGVNKNIHDQQYKKSIKIHCSEDWWTMSKPLQEISRQSSSVERDNNPYLIPTFFPSVSMEQ